MTPDNVGQQFVSLYRGLNVQNHRDIDTSKLGSHWTTDPDIAQSFALSVPVGGDPDKSTLRGVIIHAQVDPQHIVDPDSEEGKHWRDTKEVFDRGNREQEHTVRPGAPITITGMEERQMGPDDWWEERSIKNFPKQGRA